MKIRKAIIISLGTLLAGLFVFLSCYPSLEIPSINVDEANAGWDALEIIHNIPTQQEVVIFNRHLPLTSQDKKHGALQNYLLIPFIKIWGNTLLAIRICALLLGIIIICLSYWLGYKFFNFPVGAAATFLLVINSWFLTFAKLGFLFGLSMFIFSIAAIISVLIYYNSGKKIYFPLGMFLLGLGFNVKGFFIWQIISLGFLGILYRKTLKLKWPDILKGLLIFILGALPILFISLRDNIYLALFKKFSYLTKEGVNNFSFFNNFMVRLRTFHGILQGGSDWNLATSLDASIKFFPIVIFWASFIFLLATSILRKTKISWKKVTFLLSLFLCLLSTSAFTFTGLWGFHLFMLMPYAQYIIVLGLWEFGWKQKEKFRRIISTLVLITLVLFYAMKDARIYSDWIKNKKTLLECSLNAAPVALLLEQKINKIGADNDVIFPSIPFFSNLAIKDVRMYEKPYSDIKLKRIVNGMSNGRVFVAENSSDLCREIISFANKMDKKVTSTDLNSCKSIRMLRIVEQ